MKEIDRISLDEMKHQVQERVIKEYMTFLDENKKMASHKKIAKEEKLNKKAFYKRFYIVIIIGDLYPEEWIRLYYLFDRDIIKEYYDAYLAFKEDSKMEDGYEFPFMHTDGCPSYKAYA